MSPLGRLLDLGLTSLWKDGERFARIKTLSLSFQGLKIARKIFWSGLIVVSALAVTILSGFSLAVCLAVQHQIAGAVSLDVIVIGISSVGLVALAFSIWSLSEKRWLEVINYQAKMDVINRERENDTKEDVTRAIVGLIEMIAENASLQRTKTFASQRSLRHTRRKPSGPKTVEPRTYQ